jgi:fumarylacetoacetase
VPIGYHGRASSLVVSGTPVRRPQGQVKPAGAAVPTFGPCQSLDYELELAAFVGPGNALGTPIPLARAEENIFGVCLLNDWSARDIQAWEYQPLGPFLAKNFATSLSPWVVSLEALAPFRIPAFSRPAGDPAPLPYLTHPADQAHGGLNLKLEVRLVTPAMRGAGLAPHRLSQGNFSAMYWTLGQLLAHHTSNGCNLAPGDLLGSGTVSGPAANSRGCLLELTGNGREPLALPGGETRTFLQDGDEVILRGYAERAGFARIGLGECRGVVLPAGA